jgi:hypothetical protein
LSATPAVRGGSTVLKPLKPQITKLNDSRVTGQVPEYKIMLRHLYPIPDTCTA